MVVTYAQALVVAFYVAMFLALAYFVHKVLWFVRLRRVQEELVANAERNVREATSHALSQWDQTAHATWSSTANEDEDPVAYVRRMEARLLSMDRVLAERAALTRAGVIGAERDGGTAAVSLAREPRGSDVPDGVRAELRAESAGTLRAWLLERLSSSPTGETPDAVSVLTMPRIEGDPDEVALALTFPRVRRPPPPADDLYVLEVRSRYGLWRRALAFVLGAADVVYSSSHVARMSQNAQVPASVIVRRLSLVALILGAIAVDIVFSLRARMIDGFEAWLGPPPHLASVLGGLGQALDPHLATGLALGGWLAVYGAIYFGLYLFLRRRSQVHLRGLASMRARRKDDVDAIYDRHFRKLASWAGGYGHTLDDAVTITARQARLLIRRSIRRLRRRIASEELAARGEEVASKLFAELPESSAGLEDVATRHQHGFRHALWPRVEEMDYQVELARTRAAWRRVEAGLAQLRAQRPDPALVHGLWRTLAVIVRMFPDVFEGAMRERLESTYAESVRAIAAHTDADFTELDQRLGELSGGLREQLAPAGALLETQVELAEQAMEADVAALATELLELRERARLEAMAFEI